MIEKIILKRNWEDVKAGCGNALNFVTDEQVRHLFGDSLDEHITRLRIMEDVRGCDKKKLKKDLCKAEKERDAQKAASIIKLLVECEEVKKMIDNLFTTEIGSTIWQMRHPKSDTDLFRVYVASTEEILKGTANTKSKFTQEDNTDIALHEIGKVVGQLLKGNFNFFVGMMSPLTISVARQPLTKFYLDLQNIVKENVSKNCYHSIHGLAVHNFKKYVYSGKDDSERRCNKILRVLQFGKTLLDTGKFEFTPFKGGTPDDIIEWIDWLNEAYKYSQLPEKPDDTFYRDWLYNLRLYELKYSNMKRYVE